MCCRKLASPKSSRLISFVTLERDDEEEEELDDDRDLESLTEFSLILEIECKIEKLKFFILVVMNHTVNVSVGIIGFNEY